ncbi:sensor histidine kinase [uncultured Jatrophihabitans sp.]|uniref:sensor histidine kinase n=1 Tax=uncultured Jatrophihabitans sp. TaxID=1610747 RepID=UPI0035CC6B76
MPRPGRAPLRRRLRSVAGTVARSPRRWWTRQSLRARLTLLATALFSFAVATGAVLVIELQRYALTRVLDQSGSRAADATGQQFHDGRPPREVQNNVGGVAAVQVVDQRDTVVAIAPGSDGGHHQLITAAQLAEVRRGDRLEIRSPASGERLRVLGRDVGRYTVLVFTDLGRVIDSQRVLTEAALIGGPLAVLLMALASYGVAALTLRPVAALRHGAAAITAAGLARQRLPVPGANDEIHRLAVTLNAMLDRIDSATSRQRTFVGDAAHELRSPLASARVQLEVAARLGQQADWTDVIGDVLVDVERLDRLVDDLLTLAKLDESGKLGRHEPVPLDEVVASVVAGYRLARVPVTWAARPATVAGDPDSLRRVAINLIDNAVRHAAGHAAVDVGPATRRGKPVVVLSVEDDGQGIPEDERERVFDRFYRVQQSRSRETGGTGLGLPIVRDIVRSHGGSVRLSSRLDGGPGLRAEVVLPAAAPPSSAG